MEPNSTYNPQQKKCTFVCFRGREKGAKTAHPNIRQPLVCSSLYSQLFVRRRVEPAGKVVEEHTGFEPAQPVWKTGVLTATLMLRWLGGPDLNRRKCQSQSLVPYRLATTQYENEPHRPIFIAPILTGAGPQLLLDGPCVTRVWFLGLTTGLPHSRPLAVQGRARLDPGMPSDDQAGRRISRVERV